ncbi:acyl dehydratase [Moraxella caviae]|uniref:Acyl dehydratase n=1 Tax=Moraxella caviae TaxID=34060 RepID=A0A1S9ZYI8_9GAMM|nr:MaoC/PaaZ C-terminal domain-containing protein [Moraxella caviae]OOR88530.1 acyl dehydratase [Moraxella caviae]STZ14942.1 Enoyl reductase domain of yeast-type FAS1 [Moraxella caviae]VEW12684.1 Enoyl reductase domain of yeast-type FAS1 [Moraxella caviae]
MADLTFQELPKIHTTYANVIKSLLPHGDKRATSLPNSVYAVEKLAIDQGNLQEYRKICGFIDDGRVPATYYAVLSQTLQMNMMAKEEFPFAMLGLVHVENSVTQYRPVFDTETVAMTVRLDNLREHDKGQQFDFITDVRVGDELVWQGVSTYLSRQKKRKEERSQQTDKPTDKASLPVFLDASFSQPMTVSEDIGRRYAFISGDFNLIHLHALSARAFGFPKAIAHGMWSKARSLAHFQDLPRAYRVDVSFKLPIFLPSDVELVANEVADGQEFAVYAQTPDKPRSKPHLFGKITYL